MESSSTAREGWFGDTFLSFVVYLAVSLFFCCIFLYPFRFIFYTCMLSLFLFEVVSVVSGSYLTLSLFLFRDTFFIHFSFMCPALFCSQYDQLRGRGRHVAELRAARVKATQEMRGGEQWKGCSMVSAESLCD